MIYPPEKFEQLWKDELKPILPESARCLVGSRVLFYPLNRVCQEGFGNPERENLRLYKLMMAQKEPSSFTYRLPLFQFRLQCKTLGIKIGRAPVGVLVHTVLS